MQGSEGWGLALVLALALWAGSHPRGPGFWAPTASSMMGHGTIVDDHLLWDGSWEKGAYVGLGEGRTVDW